MTQPTLTTDPAVKILQGKVDALIKQVSALQNRWQSAFPGASPGQMIAGQVRGNANPGTANSMWLNFQGSTPGVGPILLMSDGTYNRVQIGNLAAYTDPNGVASPSGPGIRVLNSSGDIIFDSVGINQTFTQIASGTIATGNTSGTVADQGLISGGSASFTLARQASLFMIAQLSGYVSTTGAITFGPNIYIQITGQTASTSGSVLNAAAVGDTTYVVSTTPWQVITLAAGTYSANVYWHAFAGTADTLHSVGGSVSVFRMGG